MPYLDAAGVHTYFEVAGEGEPVVLLHGGFATIETWSAQRAALAERYRVWLPERRGHGRTPDVPGPTGYDVMARDTVAFMEAAGIGPAHLVGWSDGGTVALELALTRTELVRSLVLIGSPAHVDGYTEETRRWNTTITAESMPPFIREPYDRLSPDGPEHFPEVFRKLIPHWSSEPRHSMDELATIAVPVLILMGDRDALTVEHAAGMQCAIPSAQLAVVPDADHGVMFAKPDLVNRLIVDFLAAVAPSGDARPV